MFFIYRPDLPSTTYQLAPTTYQPTTYHQTPGSCFLKTLGPPSKCEILVLPPAPCLLPAVSFTACHLPSAFNEGRGGEIPTRKTGVVKHSSARPRIYTFPTNHFIKFYLKYCKTRNFKQKFTITDIFS